MSLPRPLQTVILAHLRLVMVVTLTMIEERWVDPLLAKETSWLVPMGPVGIWTMYSALSVVRRVITPIIVEIGMFQGTVVDLIALRGMGIRTIDRILVSGFLV